AGQSVDVNEIHVTSASGGVGTSVTRALDRNVFRALWLPDGKSFLTGGNDGTRVSLWQQPLEGAARRLELGRVNPAGSFWVEVSMSKDSAIAFTGSEPQRPV